MSHCPNCFTRADACETCTGKEIAKRDAEIVELRKMNDRLQDNILKDSCPWCGLNNKSNVKKLEVEAKE